MGKGKSSSRIESETKRKRKRVFTWNVAQRKKQQRLDFLSIYIVFGKAYKLSRVLEALLDVAK